MFSSARRGLADELVHLGVGGEVDDHVGGRVLDAADPALHRGVVAGEVLQEVAEVVGPRVQALVDAEDVMALGEQPQREVGADLAARAGDEDAHRGEDTRPYVWRAPLARKGASPAGCY